MCQDLATEVEQHRDIYLSLDSTGKKLVSGLDTQEDATLLHTRLEQMNQRWSYLKAKSIAIRYIVIISVWLSARCLLKLEDLA